LPEASCSCGQLRLNADAEPIRVTICHCLACQQRTGSAFSLNARFDAGSVRVEGRSNEYVRISDEGDERRFNFCPECGTTVFYGYPSDTDMVAVPVGCFADPSFLPPSRSIYEARIHSWLRLADGIEHFS
jgi:hypothetical protein